MSIEKPDMFDTDLFKQVVTLLLAGGFGAWAYVVKKASEKVDVIAVKLDKIVERLARLEERVKIQHIKYEIDYEDAGGNQ